MDSAQTDNQIAAEDPAAGTVDLKLEVVVIPVSDVDRAKEFYGNVGWRLDADFAFDDGVRIVQLTPPGSGCSIQFGAKLTSASPGSVEGLYLIVSDLEVARRQTDRPRCRGRGGLPRRGDRREFQPGRERPAHGAGAGARHVWLVRDVRRPGRQPLAPPGDHGTASGPGRSCGLHRLVRRMIWLRRYVVPPPPTASMRSATAASSTRTGRTGTPRTWRRSKRERSCRNESTTTRS